MKGTWARICAAVAAVLLLATGCTGTGDGGSAAATPTHTAEAGEPALPQVAGYEYRDVEGDEWMEIVDGLKAEMDAVNAEMPGAFMGVAMHRVTGPGDSDFLVVEYQVGPVLADDPLQMDGLAAGMAGMLAQLGMTVRMGAMGDVEVAQGLGDQGAGCTWTQGDLVFLVAGETQDSVNTFTEELIDACEAL